MYLLVAADSTNENCAEEEERTLGEERGFWTGLGDPSWHGILMLVKGIRRGEEFRGFKSPNMF